MQHEASNENFLTLFQTTLNYLAVLMANTEWKERKAIWNKLISANNPSEYGVIVDGLIRKSNPMFRQVPRGAMSDTVQNELEKIYNQSDFQEFHPQIKKALQDPTVPLIYRDVLMTASRQEDNEHFIDNLEILMTHITSAFGSRWHLSIDEFQNIINLTIAYALVASFDDRLDYCVIKDKSGTRIAESHENPHKRLCDKCPKSDDLNHAHKYKMVALRDTEEPIGDFKVCLCAICRHCLHCDANDPKSWEPLAWEGNFLSIIHHVKSQGQAF